MRGLEKNLDRNNSVKFYLLYKAIIGDLREVFEDDGADISLYSNDASNGITEPNKSKWN